jgi:hypothetical protein
MPRGCKLGVLALTLCFLQLSSLNAQDKSGASTAAPKPVGQSPSTAAAQQPDVSKEALVWDKLYTHIREEADGTGSRKTTARSRILVDAGVKEMAVLTFTYTASNQQVDIGYVRVIKPDGSIVVTPDYNVQDMPADVTRTAPMYSDIHQKHVAVKGLGVGDTLEYEVTQRTLKPEVPGHFWLEYTFEKNLIALDEQLDLDLPADKSVTVVSSDVQPTTTTAGNRKLYHWSSSNLARPDPDAPPKSTKHLKPSVQVTTFSSWEQVGAWYQSLQREPLVITPAIRSKAAELTKGLTGDEEKIRAIFNDVALHIHYVGLEFGIGRYQPHAADDVLSNEYGDCKDKHTLLAALLKAEGIEAWPVLISSSRELDPATPSPAQFDHVITLVPLGGKLLWMDSTEEVAPVGVMIATLRDKQALAIPAGRPAYLERTAADLPFAQSARFEVKGTLSDQGVFTGHFVQTYHGDVELIFRTVFRQVPQSQWKEAMQRFSNAIGFAGEVTNPQLSEIEQTSQPLQLSYDYTREKYGEWDDHRISPAMPPSGIGLAPGIKEKKPADEPELGSPGETVYFSSVQLPKGWFLVPQKPVELNEDWAEYRSTYSFKDGVFTAERRIQVKKSKVPFDDWEKYLNFRRSIYQDEVQMTTLVNSSQVAVSGLPLSATEGSSSAIPFAMRDELQAALEPLKDATKILEANSAPSKEDLAKALELAHKAVETIEAKTLSLPAEDAHSLYWIQLLSDAWSILGRAALENNDLPTAENYLRAAWRLSQDKISGHQLGLLLEAKGNKAAAAHQFELAHTTNIINSFGRMMSSGDNEKDRIAESYQKLTGNTLTANALNHGQYNGSLRAELDKEIEIRPLTRTSKLNASGLFLVGIEAGKPIQVNLLQGDKGIESLKPALQAHAFGNLLPNGSKARVLREIQAICTPYAGCDAYIKLPTSIQIPKNPVQVDLSPPIAPAGTKQIHIPVDPE